MSTTGETSSRDRRSTVLHRFLTAPVRTRTYKNLLYLAVAFPLGLAYFVGFVVGTSLGIGLLITLVGLPILLLTLAGATVAAGIEASLARQLVGVEASLPAALQEFDRSGRVVLPGDGFLAACKRVLTAPTTWTSTVLVFLKFAFGVFSFASLVAAVATSAAMLSAPFVYDDPDVAINLGSDSTANAYNVGPWIVDTLPEAVAVAAAGVVFSLIALNALNLLAWGQARVMAGLLSVDGDT